MEAPYTYTEVFEMARKGYIPNVTDCIKVERIPHGKEERVLTAVSRHRGGILAHSAKIFRRSGRDEVVGCHAIVSTQGATIGSVVKLKLYYSNIQFEDGIAVLERSPNGLELYQYRLVICDRQL